jgi:S-adenosylmethionine:tRNA ribosyltransferase-isomerase
VHGEREGSVAAPTAGLHFTDALWDRIKKNHALIPVTLHVGAGTFLPVKDEDVSSHLMHEEEISFSIKSIKEIAHQLAHGKCIAVGTTSLRSLESLYWIAQQLILTGKFEESFLVSQWGCYGYPEESTPSAQFAMENLLREMEMQHVEWIFAKTRIMIVPGYTFRIVDGLITNFHQPASTLLLLIAAFIGENWKKVYDHALHNRYRFLSYGDGSLLMRE